MHFHDQIYCVIQREGEEEQQVFHSRPKEDGMTRNWPPLNFRETVGCIPRHVCPSTR